MPVVVGADHMPAVLAADDRVCHPRIVQDVAHGGSLFGVQIQHPPYDVSALPRKQPEDAPWAADHLLLFAR